MCVTVCVCVCARVQLACLVGYDRWYQLGSVGCAWAAVGIGWICAVAVLLLPFALWWITVVP